MKHGLLRLAEPTGQPVLTRLHTGATIWTKVLLMGVLAWTVSAMPAAAQSADEVPPSVPYRWRNVAILGGGFVSGIVTHPTERGLMYARTDIGGAYRWDAAASRWIALNDDIPQENWNDTGVESLAVDSRDPDRVYLAVGTYTNDWTPRNGAILRSRDRGATWERVALPFKLGGNEEGRNGGERLQVDPHAPNVLLLGTRHHGLWRSDDHGGTWSAVETFPVRGRTSNGVGLVFVAFDPTSGRDGSPTPVIYVGVSGHQPNLFRSDDAGATWSAVGGAPATLMPNHGIVSPADGSLLLTYGNAAGPNGMTDGAVWRYEPAGGRWTDLTPLRPADGDRFGYAGISLDPRDPATIVVSTLDRWSHKDTLFRTRDGGKTWTSLLTADHSSFDHANAPYTRRSTPHWIGDVEIDPADPDHAVFVTGYGLWQTRNLTAADRGEIVRWRFSNEGLEETVIQDLATPAAGEALLLSAMGDLDGFRHTDLDASPADGNFQPSYSTATGIDVAGLDPDVVVRVVSGGRGAGGAVSRDNGRTWTRFGSTPDGATGGRVAIAADGGVILWNPGSDEIGPHRSSDGGATWTPIGGLPADARLASDRADPRRFYAASSRQRTLYASEDGGVTFAAVHELPAGETRLRATPGQAGHLAIATSRGLRHSRDGGRTLRDVGHFAPAHQVGFGKAAPGRDVPTMFVTGKWAGVYGFYRSDDDGATWIRINDDRHQFAFINAVVGDLREPGRVFVGSASRGILVGEPAR